MQTNPSYKTYDCAIIGGGLAGLCLSIQLSKKGHSVVLIEKNNYPFHKVCGEYISMESWVFLENLGLPLTQLKLPIITSLNVTAQNGYLITSKLDLGGFGISRYTLDNELAKIAKQAGVTILEGCKASDVKLINSDYQIETTSEKINAKIVCGSYGKINPAFINRSAKRSKGKYIAVKYHIKRPFPNSLIELHNFKDGYCGISKVDNDTCCLCYLTTTKNLEKNNNDIKQLEKNVLMQNPHLKKYFTESTFLFEKPLAISQIGFNKKYTYQNDLLILGDAAGAIAPLCGNGMSIAMRSSKIIANYLSQYFQNTISKKELIELYTKEWNTLFSLRIKAGYYLQQLFGKRWTTLFSLKFLNASPRLFRYVISLTHGKKY